MKRERKIEYWWKCEQLGEGDIPEPLATALEESAMDRINEMSAQGYVSGELCDNVNIDIPGRETPEDGWECSGWWSIS
jgi:uncharacterized membrane protein